MKFVKILNNKNSIVIGDVRPSSYPIKDKEHCRSNIQFEVGQILKKQFVNQTILEDWTIPESGGLSLDFFILPIKIAIEVQGEQHYSYSKFFHENRINFLRQIQRDRAKKDFCSLNGIIFIVVNKDNYKEMIINAFKKDKKD